MLNLEMIPEALHKDAARLYAMTPWASARYSLSDVGNGYLMADFFKQSLRYASDRNCWYAYDGRVWKEDRSGFAAMSLCKRLTHLLGLLTPMIEDEETRERFKTHVQRWRTRRARETTLKEAAEVYPLKVSEFDTDPLLFNCLNGTLALDTRILHEHSPQDMITRLANVCYNPDVFSETWDEFVLQVCETDNALHPRADLVAPDDATTSAQMKTYEDYHRALHDTAEKADYIQKAFGYALTGSTEHECMFILYGATTRNGKSTMVETFAAMMGDYAATAMPETLAQQAYPTGRGPSEDIARLCGVRFVSMSEPDRNLRLAPALIKQITGNDTITCRYLHENSFQYRPQFKLFMNTNHLPECGDDTVFASGRMRVIAFDRHFSPEERDLTLKERLRSPENLSGVLNWALRGLDRIGQSGFEPPKVIRDASASYRQDSDPVAQFVAECLQPEEGGRIKTVDVYRAFCRWCANNGYNAMNSTHFRRELVRFGQVKKARPSGGGSVTFVLLNQQFVPLTQGETMLTC